MAVYNCYIDYGDPAAPQRRSTLSTRPLLSAASSPAASTPQQQQPRRQPDGSTSDGSLGDGSGDDGGGSGPAPYGGGGGGWLSQGGSARSDGCSAMNPVHGGDGGARLALRTHGVLSNVSRRGSGDSTEGHSPPRPAGGVSGARPPRTPSPKISDDDWGGERADLTAPSGAKMVK